jgi:hypothetical protein
VDGRAIAQVVSCWLPTVVAQAQNRSGHVGFVVDKVALGQFLLKYFGSPANIHSTNCSTISIIWGWYNRPVVATITSGVSLTPLRIITKKFHMRISCNEAYVKTTNKFKHFWD